ncbi:MAG: RNA polymerase subunit sigma [Gammaproteobacteria bacterium]|nr:RNA polymerase subunit sigma [Gammaproteobacteria bacterium]
MKKNSENIDSVLIEKAKNGNKGAFNFLMNKYYPRVYASLFAFTKSREDSEDLAQQTFIKVWQQLESFRGDSAFFTWVYRIAINMAKNFVASSSYKKQKVSLSLEDNNYEAISFENIESILTHKESMEQIRKYINTLPESLKTAFALREIEGKSYEDISKITDTPIGTVRSRIFRARELILEFINKEIID